MSRCDIRVAGLTLICGTLLALMLAAGPALAGEISLEEEDDRVRVLIDGELFTQYIWEGEKPILYPVHGPDGVRMTRHYPMKEGVEGEAEDHPHQASMWWAHGDVNGRDFWHHGGAYELETIEILEQGERGVIRARHSMRDADTGDRIGREIRTLAFHGDADGRFIDFTVSVIATDGELTIGQTKEGTMGIRTHPDLRLDRGANAVNSEGVTGDAVWGKRAQWINYYGEIEGNPVGIAVFDHPNNPRHPTWWHARGYGLLAANPSGDPGFEGAYQNRDMVIPEGHAVTFRYRFYFHKGDPESAGTIQQWERFAADQD